MNRKSGRLSPVGQEELAILCVDDEPTALKVLAGMLRGKAAVLTAGSAAEARTILEEQGHRIGVIVSDERMPDETGVTLMVWARERFPDIVRIITTAYMDAQSTINAVNQGGIYQYVIKPWNFEEFPAMLLRAMEHYRETVRLRQAARTPDAALVPKALAAAAIDPTDQELQGAKAATSLRLVPAYFKKLKAAAQASKGRGYSAFLEDMLRDELKVLKRRVVRTEVKTRVFVKRTLKTETLYLSTHLMRTYHALSGQLGYANTSELVNEIIKRRLIDKKK